MPCPDCRTVHDRTDLRACIRALVARVAELEAKAAAQPTVTIVPLGGTASGTGGAR